MMKNNVEVTNTLIAESAKNASAAAHSAADAAAKAADNAAIAAKSASDSAIVINGVATDTSWVKKSLERVEETLNEMSKAFVTAAQHAEVCRIQDDHEDRLRKVETNITRILTWGSAILLILAIAEFLLNIFVKRL